MIVGIVLLGRPPVATENVGIAVSELISSLDARDGSKVGRVKRIANVQQICE